MRRLGLTVAALIVMSSAALADMTTISHRDGSKTVVQTWPGRGHTIVTKFNKDGGVISTSTVNSVDHAGIVSRNRR